jgi:hypothetical protein
MRCETFAPAMACFTPFCHKPLAPCRVIVRRDKDAQARDSIAVHYEHGHMICRSGVRAVTRIQSELHVNRVWGVGGKYPQIG